MALSASQCRTLLGLVHNPNITIKSSDKEDNVVVMDNEQYERMCLDISENPDWYRVISSSRTEGFMPEFFRILDQARFFGVKDDDTWKYMRTKNPRIPTFYALPKTHKQFMCPL